MNCKYYTVKQIIEITGLSAATLYRYRRDKKGPPYLIVDGKVLYPKDRYDEWAESLLIESEK